LSGVVNTLEKRLLQVEQGAQDEIRKLRLVVTTQGGGGSGGSGGNGGRQGMRMLFLLMFYFLYFT